MKRIITFILAIAFICAACCSFSGCNESPKEETAKATENTTQEDTQAQPITLTTENWEEYLFFEKIYGDYQCTKRDKDDHDFVLGSYHQSCVATITSRSKGNYKFKDVFVEFEINYLVSTPWKTSLGLESFYIRLDGNGSGTIAVWLELDGDTANTVEPLLGITVKSIRGTVIEN